ncbi:hypothetical protein CP10139811_0032 [Chlamydia ibidis]|uniref:Uncharacterized protein n=2 Tax=Chlamydia ibidis TaxID=1405396 RepID=S7J5E3_9CHLA|nr:hypothetical protein [Chlamydia ibidis]EPP35634.1 hypothetical protein CP10139811_0032 [Chlamydia ibidis]EQM62521.1 hypothetical protein H359_0477 [Chlamydia ibidis 10-1398/6]
MKDKSNKNKDIPSNNPKSWMFPRTTAPYTNDGNQAIFTVSEQSITSMKPVNMNKNKITNIKDPTDPKDAVNKKYLNTNCVSVNISAKATGFLPTTGGTMSGNIVMNNNKITNVSLATTTSPTPEGGARSGETTTTIDPNCLATVDYVIQKATEIQNNSQISEAISAMSSISGRIAALEQMVGIAPPPPPGSENQQPPPSTQEAPEPVFVKVAGDTMTGNLDLSGTQSMLNLETPTNDESQTVANVEYVQAKITTPQVGFASNLNGKKKEKENYFVWMSNNNDVRQNPISNTCFTLTSEEKTLQVLKPGIMFLSFLVDWTEASDAPNKLQGPIGVQVVSVTSTTGPSTLATSEQETVLYDFKNMPKKQTLSVQIPISGPCGLRIKYHGVDPSSGSSTTKAQYVENINVVKWIWQLVLMPTKISQTTYSDALIN